MPPVRASGRALILTPILCRRLRFPTMELGLSSPSPRADGETPVRIPTMHTATSETRKPAPLAGKWGRDGCATIGFSAGVRVTGLQRNPLHAAGF